MEAARALRMTNQCDLGMTTSEYYAAIDALDIALSDYDKSVKGAP